jgi:hypothetical protein
MSRRIRRHIRSNVVGYIALFFALSTGSAFALSGSNTVQSDDLGPGAQVKAPDIANNAVNGAKVVNNSIAGTDLAPNSVTSGKVVNGSIGTADLAPAAVGARAYGSVANDGTLSKDKNVVSVTNPSAGSFCITLAAGIDPSTAVLVVGPDAANNSTGLDALGPRLGLAEWVSTLSQCPAGTVEVMTRRFDFDGNDNNDGTGDGPGDDIELANQGFAFVVP